LPPAWTKRKKCLPTSNIPAFDRSINNNKIAVNSKVDKTVNGSHRDHSFDVKENMDNHDAHHTVGNAHVGHYNDIQVYYTEQPLKRRSRKFALTRNDHRDAVFNRKELIAHGKLSNRKLKAIRALPHIGYRPRGAETLKQSTVCGVSPKTKSNLLKLIRLAKTDHRTLKCLQESLVGVFYKSSSLYTGTTHCLSTCKGWVRIDSRLPFSFVRKVASKLAVLPSSWTINGPCSRLLKESE
jgi:hypothetical protein